jgi:quercetin dioxygenase-like cupin family protein
VTVTIAAHTLNVIIRIGASGSRRFTVRSRSMTVPQLKTGDGVQIPPETAHAGGEPGDAKTKVLITYVVEIRKAARVSSLGCCYVRRAVARRLPIYRR